MIRFPFFSRRSLHAPLRLGAGRLGAGQLVACAMVMALWVQPIHAQAPRAYFASDDPRTEALATALSVEMPGWEIVSGPAPQGFTPLERAGQAQLAARTAGAELAIWAESGPEGGTLVRAVEVNGETPRHAPLPTGLDGVEPRTFAVVASSLVDEVRAPPQPIRVRVRVEVEGENIVVDTGSATVTAGGQTATAALGNAGPEVRVVPEGTIVEAPLETADPVVIEDVQTDPAIEVATEAGAPVDEDEDPHVVFGADFLPFVGSSSRFRGRETRTLSGGVLGAYSGALEGLGLSLGLNITRRHMHGAAIAAGGNIAGGGVVGVQIASGFNWASEVRGAQISSGLNVATGKLRGVQISSGANFARGGRGAQIGLLNIQRDRFEGVQLGLLNISEDANFALGLVNVVRQGRTHIEVSGTAEGFGFSMVKHGGDHWHYLYSVGGRPFGEEPAYSLGFGIGGHLTPARRLFIDIDALAHYLSDGDYGDDGTEMLSQLRLVVGIKLLERFALLAGVSLNALSTYKDTSEYSAIGTHLGGDESGEGWRVTGFPSLMLGVQIL